MAAILRHALPWPMLDTRARRLRLPDTYARWSQVLHGRLEVLSEMRCVGLTELFAQKPYQETIRAKGQHLYGHDQIEDDMFCAA